MEEVKISTAGDSALLIEFGQEISPEDVYKRQVEGHRVFREK